MNSILAKILSTTQPISEKMFGANQLFKFDALSGLNTTFETAIDKLGVSALRFPGGAMTEISFDINHPNSTTPSKGQTSTNVGLSEFLTFAERTSRPIDMVLPTARLYNGSADALHDAPRSIDSAYFQSVLDFVRLLLTRGDSGPNALPDTPISTLEIGNEYWGSAKMTAREYGQLVNALVPALQSIFNEKLGQDAPHPSIAIQMGSPLDPQYKTGIFSSLDYNDRLMKCNQDIINEIKNPTVISAISSLVQHYYYSSTDDHFSQNTWTVNSIDKCLDIWDRAGFGGKEAIITEWNVGLNNIEQLGLKGASVLVSQMSYMLQLGVDAAYAWPVQGFNNELVDNATPGLSETPLGAAFHLMSEDLVGLSLLPYKMEGGTLQVQSYGSESKIVLFLSSRESSEQHCNISLPSFISGFTSVNGIKIGIGTGLNVNDPTAHAVLTSVSGGELIHGHSLQFDLNGFEVMRVEFDLARDLTVDGSDGPDVIFGDMGDDSLSGGEGDDTIVSLDGADTIFGDLGNDSCDAGGGSDLVRGGDGNDRLNGGWGWDTIYGDEGTDVIFGSSGSDLEYGGAGNDRIVGGSGSDTLYGDSGIDTIFGGLGNDQERGGDDNDRLLGDEGSDTLYGGDGRDYLKGGADGDLAYGEDGNDWIYGDGGNDSLFGGKGKDLFSGGPGNDVISGGAGDDTALLSGAHTDYTVTLTADGLTLTDTRAASPDGSDTFSGVEQFTFADGTFAALALGGNVIVQDLSPLTGVFVASTDDHYVVNGLAGADNITTLNGFDTIAGGAGNDTINTGGGDDVIHVTGAVDGYDQINGGAGFDKICAQAAGTVIGLLGLTNVEEITAGGLAGVIIRGDANGNLLDFSCTVLTGIAQIDGAKGADTLIGSAGSDVIIGGLGTDKLTGGQGADTFIFAALAESYKAGGDTITDFARGQDHIDLSLVDADVLTAGAQHFAFVGSAVFTHSAGELRLVSAGGRAQLLGDVNGDGAADLVLNFDLIHGQAPVFADLIL